MLCALAALQAQHMVKGTVVEETRKGVFTPLYGAAVVWLHTAIGTTTDTLGNFSLEHKPGLDSLVVSYVGSASDTIKVTSQNMNNLRIVLETVLTVDEVEVVGEQKATTIDRLNSIKANIMTEKELFKAACCNLSESFETNPSIDVNYTDAITGTKQIQMLGLAGTYTQITTENMPGVRGLASSYGLGYLPGTWIESIQVSKGVGSVANGYESITGQINAEMRKPQGKDKVFANAYASAPWGRYEGNLVLNHDLNKKVSGGLLLHASTLTQKMDVNNDGFQDMPTGYQLNGINRWKFSNNKTIEGEVGVKALLEDRLTGQMGFNPSQHKLGTQVFGASIKTERFELFGKTGYVFPGENYKSIGFMWSALTHTQNSYFGQRYYNARQQSLYANLIYQSMFGNTNHKYRTGVSFLRDVYNESLNPNTLPASVGRIENVPGAFFEYTWTARQHWVIVAGLRGDYHNLFGFFATPRIHARYDRGNGTTLHFTAGRGQRTANIFAENIQYLSSARNFMLPANWASPAYGLKPEVAWNFGTSLTTEVKIGRRYGTLEADIFHTLFQNQVVVDLDRSAQAVYFYNLNGQSYANSAQVQFTYQPMKKFETRIAYRYYDVKTQYLDGLLEKYLLSRHRAFINIAYTAPKKWVFDFTTSWFGPKRIPNTSGNPESYRMPGHSPAYVMINAQVTKTIGRKWDIYGGGENLLGFRQTRLIISPGQPFGQYFDPSLTWGPIQGRMFYAGVRYRIKK